MKKKNSKSYFSDFIAEIMQGHKYGLAKAEDIHGQPHVHAGEEAEKLSETHNELILFEMKTQWEFCVCFFFLPWFRKIPDTLKLVAIIKRPDFDHLDPPKIMCFDDAFFEHLEILKANGMVFNHELSTVTNNQMNMGYEWNSARGMYEPVLKKK